MQNNLINFLKPEINFKPGHYPSVFKLVSVYVIAFVSVLILLNGPLIISLIVYPLTHSEESENERLTAQYITLYGDHGQEQLNKANKSFPIAKTVTSLASTLTPTPTPSVSKISSDVISISKINISAPILQVLSDNEKTILSALKNGVVLYPGSSYPGQNGSTIIIGHSSSNPPWTKYSAIFSLLNRLAPNDLINISFGGKKYIYQVRTIEKGSVQHLLDSGLGGDLILSSCWPVGTDQGRIAVVANLIK